MRKVVRAASLIVVLVLVLVAARAESAEHRPAVFISDLHFGLGANDPKEDFRWSTALSSFLDHTEAAYPSGADLVILGDMLELWQPPTGVECTSGDANYGCTIPQMEELARLIVKAHAADLERLGVFASRNNNRLIVVPGNHDSALLIKSVWAIVEPTFKALPPSRVVFEPSGVWSPDGLVVAEHGHQIWPDVNLYKTWPVVWGTKNGTVRMLRPWGEYFVQRLYNKEEDQYPLIDNLTGSSAGVKYRMHDRGTIGTLADVARFIRFVLLETSSPQQVSLLGDEASAPNAVKWDVEYARSLGSKLVVLGLPAKDPMSVLLESRTADAAAIRTEIDEALRAPSVMSDDEVRGLCDAAAELQKRSICLRPNLGEAAKTLHLIPRSHIIRTHLEKRLKDYPNLSIFIYGHTHKLEEPWDLKLSHGENVTIVNTGAFQRLIDDESFRAAATREHMTPEEALKKLPFSELPPCHSVVTVTYDGNSPSVVLQNWVETATGGKLVAACDKACAKLTRCH